MKHIQIKKMVLSAFFLALALALPFLTGQIPEIGSMLLPMHLPVLLCGFVCGPWWGLAVGLVAPVLRSVIFGMPPMYPTALSMALELGTYGLVSGLLYAALPRRAWSVYASLLCAMIAGRLVWGAARLLMTMAPGAKAFTWPLFLSGAVTAAIPGIALQIVVVPALVLLLEKYGQIPLEKEEHGQFGAEKAAD